MTETLIWIGGLVIEALIAVAVVLTVLLRRSRKAERQLLAQLAEKEKSAGEAVPAEVPAQAPPSDEVQSEPPDVVANLKLDMTALRDALKHSENQVQKLQAEKEALAAEHAALNKEYQRLYANSENKEA